FRQRAHYQGDEVVGIAHVRVFHAGAGHDRHGHFGEVIEYQVVHLGLADQLEGRGVGIAPETGGAADADRIVAHDLAPWSDREPGRLSVTGQSPDAGAEAEGLPRGQGASKLPSKRLVCKAMAPGLVAENTSNLIKAAPRLASYGVGQIIRSRAPSKTTGTIALRCTTQGTPMIATQSVYGMDETPRGKLLSAAARLFREQGYDRTTVRDIAAAVGIQSGSIFHHFASKEDILFAVTMEVIRFNTERMRLATEGVADPEQRLRGLIRAELQSIVGDTREA